MKAIISDVHGNVSALEAVLSDINLFSVDEIIFLGDIVGKGQDNSLSIDLIAECCSHVLYGNHDMAAINIPSYFERDNITSKVIKKLNRLNGKKILKQGRVTYVHGSPNIPYAEYLYPDAAIEYAAEYMMKDEIIFCAHTHTQCLANDTTALIGNDLHDWIFLSIAKQWIINCGSVGYPRDQTNPSYVLYNNRNQEVFFRRLTG